MSVWDVCTHDVEGCLCRWSAEAKMMRRTRPIPHPVNVELSDGPLTMNTQNRIMTEVAAARTSGDVGRILEATNEAEAAGLAEWDPQARDWKWRTW